MFYMQLCEYFAFKRMFILNPFFIFEKKTQWTPNKRIIPV